MSFVDEQELLSQEHIIDDDCSPQTDKGPQAGTQLASYTKTFEAQANRILVKSRSVGTLKVQAGYERGKHEKIYQASPS